MFSINDMVIHTGMGVCKIIEIKKMAIGKNPEEDYYVLSPIYENKATTIFVPTNSNLLRPPICRENIQNILKSVIDTPPVWCENNTLRKSIFTEILKSGDPAKIIKLLCELHEARIEKEKSGKRLHINDENILKKAETIIHSELAYTMQIEPDKVAEFIMSEIL